MLAFSMAGMTVVLIRNEFYMLIGVQDAGFWIKFLLFLVFFLPTHNLLLLVFGFFLGQFSFFWSYEKRFVHRITKPFRMISFRTTNHSNDI